MLFERLVRDYSPRLLPVLRRYAPGRQHVEDLLQEVWLRAFQKRHTFSGRGSLLGWLLTICRTVGLAGAGARAATGLAALDASVAEGVAPAREYTDELERLRAAIDRLPDRQREVVLLRVVEGRSTADAARILQCAEGTVKAALHQAIDKLYDALKEKVS